MTFDEALALPTGTLVTGVQPCDGVEYQWVRTFGDKADVLQPGQTDGRVLVMRPDTAPDDQHKFLFIKAALLDLV